MELLHWDSSIGVVEQILERRVMARVSLVVARNMLGVLDGDFWRAVFWIDWIKRRKGFGGSLYGTLLLNEKKEKGTGAERNVLYKAGRN
jgi:hypothetical protein